MAQKIKGITPERIGIIIGDLQSAEEIFSLKELANRRGIKNIDCRQDGSRLGELGGRAGYLFNSAIAGIDQADAILLIGTNPRLEAPVLNARIRKRWLKGNLPIAVIGERADLTYGYEYLGAGPESLWRYAGHGPAGRQKPMVIVGQGALARPDGKAVLSAAVKAALAAGAIKDGWNGFNVLHMAAARVGGLDVCGLPSDDGRTTAQMLKAAKSGELELVFLFGADEINMAGLGSAYVIYQGSHGDKGAHRADIVLPGAAYTEKSGTYVNTEGRPQMARRAAFPPGEAREDWAIFRALSEQLGQTLPWNSLSELRAAMYRAVPHLQRLDQITPANPAELQALADAGGKLSPEPFKSPIEDFYLTNPIARASRIMGECSALKRGQRLEAAE
jgi:NADH-quinone oxidoreductase subunit G